MLKNTSIPLFQYLFFFFLLSFSLNATASIKFNGVSNVGSLVKKEERKTVELTEFGQISAVEISDGIGGPYHLQFITLEPNSLFLPVLLHADMVFYVHTGGGRLSWVYGDEKNQIDIRRGDIFRLGLGSVFYVRSSLESTREKLRIHAIFTTANDENSYERSIRAGAYSTLSDLVLGFDKKVLQAGFGVPEEVLEVITSASRPPAIVHVASENKTDHPNWKVGIIEALIGRGSSYELNSKKKKTKAFNILHSKPDFENCNGWSLTVNKKDLNALKGSNMGVFMVNLTKGSMMGPHWNPRATEIAIVTHGEGMVRVVCSSSAKETECKNTRFSVKEGDVFAVPRFHPMAQMSFNNDSLVFMGFSTMAKKNHPQFLVGKSSVLQALDKDILAMSFNVPNTTIDQLLTPQMESIILECTSCAEEEEKTMQEEIERERQEEEAREREEAKRREEEKEAREREKEEEEARKKEEEEAAKKREEEKREQEEERKRQEEEAKREEEEAKRQEEERQERERQEEEEDRRKEEEARQRQEEEEAQRRQEEEEAQKQQEEEEEEAQQRQEEEEEARRQKEEEAQREEEEEAARRQKEEEEARREEEEEEAARRQKEEEEARRQKEEEEEEEAAQRQKEEEEARRQKEEEEEEEAARRQKEEEEEGGRKREEEREKEEEEGRRRERGEGRRVLKKMWKV